ncbi:flagellar protein FlgA [Brevibacterium daeguense]|uniref:Flagellar protein FlgA n=1 Tax=Brevibacterium daeguense TaxID=909936 RepID=A0ABP8EMH4_9MICO|nr:SAF domain-containing protein [Brevibacterium daeguense]
MSQLPIRRAERLRAPRWRDPRLVIGAVIVLLSVLGTWFVVQQAAATTTVWAASRPLVPGSVLTPEDVVPAEVRLGEESGVYLSTENSIPEGATVLASVAPGELVPASQLGSPDQLAGRVMALSVPDALPAAVQPGSKVDVWATDAEVEPVDPREILTAIDVIAVQREAGDFSSYGGQRIEIFVPNQQVGSVMRALAAGHHISVVAVPQQAAGR